MFYDLAWKWVVRYQYPGFSHSSVVLYPLGPMIEPTGSDHLNVQGRVRNIARVTQIVCCASCWGTFVPYCIKHCIERV
jgi:hypothetical protein